MTDLLSKKEPVVIAKGVAHQGALHGMISGGGTLPSQDKVHGIRLTPISDKFVGWEIITYGIEDSIKFKKYEKTKVIHIKTEKKIKEVNKDITQEELI